MVTKYLFIEGGKETKNGDLRQGFNLLLSQLIEGKMPRISMGSGKKETIDKFKNNILGKKSLLLVDLDSPESNKEKDLTENNLIEKKDSVFYMIQEMEAWFISQPEILDEFYQVEISKKLPKKDAALFIEPDKELQKLTKNSKKGAYHKVLHGVELLKKIDSHKLLKTFPDFEALIVQLSKS